MAESWKTIALALGNAMANHQYCDDQSLAEPEPDCPFCKDRAVYLCFKAFAEKHGATFRDPLAGMTSVSIYDLRRNP
jgi:hypothetical protein